MGAIRVEDLGVVPIQRATVHDRVYAQLRDLLMRGRFQPGQPLTIIDLAEAFGTSAQPVRDAIRQLVAEKALVARPNRTAAIPIMDAARLEDVRRVRIAVEGLAAELAATRITPAQIDELALLVEREVQADRADQVEVAVAQNRAFHARLYAISGSQALPPIIDSLWLQIGPYIRRAVEHIDVQGGPAMHHLEAIKALRNGTPRDVRDAIERDINRFFEIAFDVVRTMQTDPERTEDIKQ